MDEEYRVEVFQDDLSLKFSFKRDTTFSCGITNKSVGLNVVEIENGIETLKELVSKKGQANSRKNSEKWMEVASDLGGEDNLLWQL